MASNNQKSLEISDELDIFTAAEHLHELKFMAIEEPKLLISKECPEREKQISVDPISLRESSRKESSFNFMLPPICTPLDGPPVKPPLISCSVPNSACSSPRFSFGLLKKKWKNESQASPRQINRLAYRHFMEQEEMDDFRMSRSCAEGRSAAKADELDLWFSRPSIINFDAGNHRSFTKVEAGKDDLHKVYEQTDERFKCGALCMYLPGFSKGKPVRSKKEQAETEAGNTISRTVSLEKFECGSWASSGFMNDHEDGDSMNRYFDLPLELIQTNANDATSPVSAAFVFEKGRKGVLKNNSSKLTPRKSHESLRHVRFSTSSPSSPSSCITPRLRKAREDFNAFLEAQST